MIINEEIYKYIEFCNKSENVTKNDYYDMINKVYNDYSDITYHYIDYINRIQNTIGYSKIPDINIRINNARVKILKHLSKNNINFYNFNLDKNSDCLFTCAIESYLYNKYCKACKYIEEYLDVNLKLKDKYNKKINKFKFMIGKLSVISDLKNKQNIIYNYKNVCDSLDNITDKSELLNIAISYLNQMSFNNEAEKKYVVSTYTNVYANILHTLNCDSEIKQLLEESYKVTSKVLKK
ncbi:MAG: hypothetical protein J6G98_02675 [Bacilli bacterium]|nr:hypothetical protein [Bacilli bacterium]